MYWSLDVASPAVERVWIGDSEVEAGIGHRSDPVLGCDVVITRLGNDVSFRVQGPLTERRTYPHVVGAEYFGIRFAPGAGIPGADHVLHQIRDDSITTSSIGALPVDRLAAAAASSEPLATRGRLVSGIVHEAHCPDPAPIVTQSLAWARSNVARASVSSAARALDVTERHLQRVYRRTAGISPNLAFRMLRIEVLTQLVSREPRLDLAAASHLLGYADQSHMTHETRRFLQTTPGRLIGERSAHSAASSST